MEVKAERTQTGGKRGGGGFRWFSVLANGFRWGGKKRAEMGISLGMEWLSGGWFSWCEVKRRDGTARAHL